MNQMTPRSVSQHLAEWAAGLTPDVVGPDMERATVDTLIDVVGLCVSARNTDYVRSLIQACGDDTGACGAIGHSGRYSPTAAALINGTAAHGEDFDNTFEGCPVHSGAVIVPAVLALAERRGLSGAVTVTAMAAGIEIMCRLGLVANTAVHKAGFHPTAVLGTLAAAVAVAVAAGEPAPAITRALGIAGSLSSGIIEYLADGTSTKRLHAGWAAQSGMRAAGLGAAGFTGPVTVMEGNHGFFSAFAPSIKPDFSPLLDGLGTEWVGAKLAFKPYACGTMVQPYIDCARALRARGVALDDIDRIVCPVGQGTVHRLWEPLPLKQNPPSPYAAKFSTPFCMAIAFIEGDAGLAQFTEAKIHDPAILALAARISHVVDPANEYPRNYSGHLIATLRDGSTIRLDQPHLRGGSRAPLSHDELERKFHRNAAFGGWSPTRADATLTLLRDFVRQPDVSKIDLTG
ncbi:2-methylcitrate dehydratase [Skermanella stibiiresistens SB22]|uniref:2-methylcitrate dehydratase n=1 Tax=Skermanella stibiiresistens SB22 TaxID=1385369 RepID=W9H6Q2_9PROT|nr:MmgE/PrpD family protein [Skermanella stibiiresistens]EWY41699.1 2-methylcitrate dehydratase [Skermanella stibiiresistens SB22]